MSSLFARSSKKRKRPAVRAVSITSLGATSEDGERSLAKRLGAGDAAPLHSAVDASAGGSSEGTSPTKLERVAAPVDAGQLDGDDEDASFASLGLCEWLQRSCLAMGFRAPTAVQRHCIPAILRGRDVLGCAETGSGKTAAFALPILHDLSRDPYGIFALVLTPTRELAIQISEQLAALGALMSLRHAVVIGGVSMLAQSEELARRPHVVVATPGRLRDHLEGPQPPPLAGCRYVVLDEADRLLSRNFQESLSIVLGALPPRRQTLLFSATMTDSLQQLDRLAMADAVRYDLTKKAAVPASLQQEYLFMPAHVKTSFLALALRVLARTGVFGDPIEDPEEEEEDAGINGRAGGNSGGGRSSSSVTPLKRARSAIVFVGSCEKCQEVCELLLELGADCVCLHGMMTQKRRMAALGKFKSCRTRLLIATDVASRGLDIPEVDLVVNFDMPAAATDYVHRVGRTARQGRRGRAVSLVSQHDVALVHNVERFVRSKLAVCAEVKEADVLPLMNRVTKAARVAKIRLMEQGFEDRVAAARQRKDAARGGDRQSGGGGWEKGGEKRSREKNFKGEKGAEA